MKKLLATILAFGMLAWAGSAMATPVTFDVDGATDSYVNLTNVVTHGPTSISADLATDLDDNYFILDDNESMTIDFFTFSATGTGLSSFDLDANLNFDTPEIDAGGAGEGFWVGWGGSFSFGVFNWDNAVQEFTLDDGNIISIAMEDGFACGPGSEITIHATITNLGGGTAPVPEPSTILLMGSGLLSLVGYSRKRFSKKS